MASPMRLDASLIAAAEREAALQKRSIPKQIEFWAELGKAVEHLIDFDDVVAVTQGLKTLEVSPLLSSTVRPDDVFADLEIQRSEGVLTENVTAAAIYYEASRTSPGCLDRVHSGTGKRETGHFQNGLFTVHE